MPYAGDFEGRYDHPLEFYGPRGQAMPLYRANKFIPYSELVQLNYPQAVLDQCYNGTVEVSLYAGKPTRRNTTPIFQGLIELKVFKNWHKTDLGFSWDLIRHAG